MPRRMSCSLTVDAVRERRKTVTRRHVDTWRNLKPGDRLTLIEKGMGLPKGSRQIVVAEVEVLSNRVEALYDIDDRDVEREGFDGWTPGEFCSFWLESHGYRPQTQNEAMAVQCRRICWRYLDDPPEEMVRVEQTILYGDDPEIPGNCLQAAVATVLGLDLDRVPHFVWAAGSQWLAAVKGWAADRGLAVTYAATTTTPSWPCVLLGESPRGVQHAVAWDGFTAHDPHPTRAGLTTISHLIEFVEAPDA